MGEDGPRASDQDRAELRSALAPATRGKIYGRRKGHPLRERQQRLVETLLPLVKLDLSKPFPGRGGLFGAPLDALWLEIGFGGAEHLLWQARHNPRVGLIGCEPFINGTAKALTGIEDGALGNIRLHADDARDVLDWLPPASLDRVFLLFPDPWPKKRHRKRRFINDANLDRLARAMKPGAELRVGSDIPEHTDWILRHMAARTDFRPTADSAEDWRARPEDWPRTRYEERAIKAGRKPAYLTFRRA